MSSVIPSLFEDYSTTATYSTLYGGLAELREEFHKSGRFDDSNAKLDEVVKLFATYLAFKLGDLPSFPIASGAVGASFVEQLQGCFSLAATLPYYLRNDGVSIFGPNASLTVTSSEPALAKQLTVIVAKAVDAAFRQQDLGNPYDILNETFGHFVRDNFRGNIEDAQYLTPAEVVDFMVGLSLFDAEADGRLDEAEPFRVADPCCGVGSFLTTFASKYRSYQADRMPELQLYGQDKVDRMVRLATLNLTLFRVFEHEISIGNSLYKNSPLDDLNGKVDVVLTNPPFGARFSQGEIASLAGDNTPFFSSLSHSRKPLESELLFVDRDLQLLRDGGRLYIVVPDGVVSAGGLAALLRHHVRRVATLEAVIELPSVTFAQAGTRTKTAVVCLRKLSKDADAGSRPVFMAVSRDLGFQVNSRKGVQVKTESGANDLPSFLAAYQSLKSLRGLIDPVEISRTPLALAVPAPFIRDAWTPGHYHVKAFGDLPGQSTHPGITTEKLANLVNFVGVSRRAAKHQAGVAFISVLHVLGEGIFDFAALEHYAPKTPGVPVRAGEVLISRINPRIPRVVVVPDLGRPMLCSTEFEIMAPKDGLNAYALAYLLLSRGAQSQIQGLTSGTSASHNRIKQRELGEITLPIPVKGSGAEATFAQAVNKYRRAIEELTENHLSIVALRESEDDWRNGTG